MDRVECSAVYIDDRVNSEGWVSRRFSSASAIASDASPILSDVPQSLRSDVQLLLLVCKKIYLCRSGTSFANKLAEIGEFGENNHPVFAFFDVELGREDSIIARRKANRASWPDLGPPSPTSLRRGFTFSSQSEESYGLQLLSGLSSDIQLQESPSLIIPIAILRTSCAEHPDHGAELQQQNHLLPDPQQISKCLDAGAIDVLTTPLEKARMQGLVVQAYRTQKTAQRQKSRFLARRKSRKHSWVGVHDEQPYAYLREAMVSKLMKGICNPEETIEDFQDRELDIRPERESYVKDRIGSWDFTAHEFTEDELVFGACEMLQHAFRMPELEPWRLSSTELRTFLLACRAAYNSFVLYHNFRHAIDVVQSVFCFLLHIGALPPHAPVVQSGASKSPIASLLSPFDTLTLLISAIGHDVGHPGVNNFFLVKLNAPLAQLYNDNSVLEAFHCAAFSQILRRHWPAAFKDKQLRKLLISSILATDMGVHQKFMERLGSLQEKFHENNRSIIGWKPQDIDMYKTLLCGLLIKCADISNVARPWDVAEQWTKILQEEFANQGEMEREVGMETALFGGPPELGNTYKLATGQIGFMSIFAVPLFEGVSDILPQLKFTVEQIRSNQSRWHYFADLEKRKQSLHDGRLLDDGLSQRSPRSQSPAVSFKTSRSVQAKDDVTTPQLAGEILGAEAGETEAAVAATAAGDVDGKPSEGAEDYFGPSPISSVGTASPRGYNENTISPVVSPDTPGPSMDITGSPMPPPDETIRRSPENPEFISSLANASRRGSGAQNNADYMEPLPGAVDRNRTPTDPSVLAAMIFANASKHDGEAQDPSRSGGSDGDGVDTPSGDHQRPGSSRHGPFSFLNRRRPHANTNSTGRTSGPSTSQRNSCTRTHSVSTYSNNMTPISPATNATSFLTVDSMDDDDDDKKSAGSLSRSEREPGSSTRPSTSDPSAEPDSKASTDPSSQLSAPDSGHKSNFMASLIGNRPSTSPPPRSTATTRSIDDRRRSRTPPPQLSQHLSPPRSPSSPHPSSSPHSPNSPNSPNSSHPHDHQNGGEQPPRRLPKKRSRLRLAFWRRRNHHSHQQELSGET